MQSKFSLFSLVMGVIFILLGIGFLVSALVPVFSGFSLWPLFLLLPVVGMLSGARSREEVAKVIFWVVYLVYMMVFFLVLNFIGWDALISLWPHFLFAAAMGFLVEFFFTRDMGKLWGMIVTGIIGVYFFIPGVSFFFVIGVLFILWGIGLLLSLFIPSVKKRRE